MRIRKAVVDAVLELGKKKDIDQITIKEILTTSGVSKSSFYRIFEDKYDALNGCYQFYVDQLIQDFDGHNWEEQLVKTLEFVNSHGAHYERLTGTNGVAPFSDFLFTYTFDFYSSVYFHNTGEKELSEETKRSIVFIAGGAIMILKHWLSRNRAENYETIAKSIYANIPPVFREYLD